VKKIGDSQNHAGGNPVGSRGTGIRVRSDKLQDKGG